MSLQTRIAVSVGVFAWWLWALAGADSLADTRPAADVLYVACGAVLSGALSIALALLNLPLLWDLWSVGDGGGDGDA